jgi:hypothetical protein
MSLLSSLIGPATEIAGKFIQDKDKAAELAHDLSTMADRHHQEIALSQIEVNKAEAASGSLFKGGWRPFVGWICGFALLYHFILCPLIIFVVALTGTAIPPLPEFDMGSLMTVLLGMLGIGGLRSFEKTKGLTK